MVKLVARPCPICNSMQGEILHTQRYAGFDEWSSIDHVETVACCRCGMVYADVVSDQDTIDETYRTHSKYADTSLFAEDLPPSTTLPAVREAPWDWERLVDTAGFLATRAHTAARVLDAGCATGALVELMTRAGFTDVVGLDPSPAATATARQVRGVSAVTASFFEPPADLGRFGLVTLCHVLEHLTEIETAVLAIAALLETGGLAYIEVPDAAHYSEHLVAPVHDFNSEHINHFSLPLLSWLMGRHGLEPVELGEKVVRCAPSANHPAIYGLWRKTSRVTGPVVPPRDEALVTGIRNYVSASQLLLTRLDANLTHRIAGRPVAVWGTGELALRLLRDTVLADARIAGMVDGATSRQGLHIDGHRIHAPTWLASRPHLPIVVATMHHQDGVLQAITNLGLSNEVILLDARKPAMTHITA
jgi:2-polyprenyl-3-methyl-5-hydroxy-6-metoxy-1,4-benzoquinol methylase